MKYFTILYSIVAYLLCLVCIVQFASGVPFPFQRPTVIRHIENNDINVIENDHLLNVRFWEKLYPISKVANAMRSNIGSSTDMECIACKIMAKALQYMLHMGVKRESVVSLVTTLCKRFHISTDRVCEGLVKSFQDEVMYVFTKVSLNPANICGSIVDADCGMANDPSNNWTLNLPMTLKPPVTPIPLPKPDSPVLKVLQISDIHLDPDYLEGANAECGEPLCCHSTDVSAHDPGKRAGAWGDYRKCDTPLHMLENMFLHINKTHAVDYIIWTGDDPPHNVWNQSREGQIAILEKVADLIRAYFPNVPVFPALGNHEGIPVNSFPPPSTSSSMDWLYESLSKTWALWLPPNTASTIRKWLLLNTTDPLGELQWLIVELANAELAGEKVHIIGHIPPGSSDCLKAWSSNYYRIVNRYESTIRSSFFGHIHVDAFQMFYDLSNSLRRPASVAYVGPSITPYTHLNPAYRIYSVDGNYANSTWAVLDHETHFLNLTDANIFGKPIWKFGYRAKEAYNMTSLQPADWDDLIKTFARNDTAFQLYYSHYHRESDAYELCDAKCKRQLLCDMQMGRSDDNTLCVI